MTDHKWQEFVFTSEIIVETLFHHRSQDGLNYKGWVFDTLQIDVFPLI